MKGYYHYSRDVRWLKETLNLTLPTQVYNPESDSEKENNSEDLENNSEDQNYQELEESDQKIRNQESDVTNNEPHMEYFETPNKSFHSDDNQESETSNDDNQASRLLQEKQRSEIDTSNIIEGKRTRRGEVEIIQSNRNRVQKANSFELLKEACAIYKDMQYEEALETNEKEKWIQGIK